MGDAAFVVLELLDGTPLDAEIRRRTQREAGPFTAAELRSIFEPVLEALAFAHAEGIVHRDIKPSNIMVLRRAGILSAKILDFGMAAGAPGATTTTPGLTPLYAAPEQWNASYGSIGPWTDVFALGLCLEQAATLHAAVSGDSLPEIVASATSTRRGSRIARERPDLPRALEEIVVRATRVWPKERFQSVQAMLDAMRAALNASTTPLRPSGASPPIGTSPPPSPYASTVGAFGTTVDRSRSLPLPQPTPYTQPLPPGVAPQRSGTPVGCIVGGLLATFVGLLAVGGGVAALYLSQSDDETSATAVDAAAPPAATPNTPSVRPAPAVSSAVPSAKPIPAATRTNTPASPPPAPSPAPSPSPSPTAPAAPAAAQFYVSTGNRGGIDPDFPKFSAVVAANGSSMRRCFAQEGITDEWSVVFEVTFRAGGARGIRRSSVTHAGVAEQSIIATRIKECTTNEAVQWPWPQAPHYDDMPDKAAFLRILTGMSAPRTPTPSP
jgi:serine/threonine-protein kinase